MVGQVNQKMAAIVLIAACFLSAVPASAGGRKLGDMAAPRLLSPSDDTDLTGKDKLEFRWGTEGGNFDYHDFRLYKGAQTYESGLILKKQVPRNEHSLFLDASQFESGQTYAWSLRYVGSSKSRSSYSVFSVKK